MKYLVLLSLCSVALWTLDGIAQQQEAAPNSPWKLSFVGAGNIFYNYYNTDDENLKGNADPVQLRRTYVDVIAEKKSSNGLVTGARVRLWMEPVVYSNEKMHQDGFGSDDTRTPLDFLNEVEAYIQNIPLNEGKTNLISITAGKGYVRFGLDRPEEQAPFSEFPLIHPVTKAGGLGQVMHVRVSYKNTSAGLEVDSEIFEPTTPDAEYFDIDLPNSFGQGQAISVRKTMPLGLVAVGSFANMKFADSSTTNRYSAGLKLNRNLGKDTKMQAVVEYAFDDKQLANGASRETKAVLVTGQLTKGKNTAAFQYGRVLNPARPEDVNQYTGYFGRQLAQRGKLKITGFVEAENTTGTQRSAAAPGTLSGKRAAAGIQFKF